MFNSNPILFKDLLISLNSKIGKNIIISFLIIYFILLLLILSGIVDEYTFEQAPEIGDMLFSGIGIVQIIVLCIIGFFKGLLSISTEKEQKTFSFIKISPISSFNFILGKFLAIFIYLIILFLISLPFLSIGLLLGGVNIFDVLIYTLYSISYISLSIFIGIFISILSKKFSIIISLSLIPVIFAAILALFVFIPFESLNLSINTNQENVLLSILPIFMVFGFLENPYIILFGVKLHYIIYHILIFASIITLILRMLLNKYKNNYINNIKNYSYIESLLLLILILLVSTNYFYSILIFFLLNSILFLFNDKNILNGKITKSLLYLIIIFLLGIGILIFLYGFIINVIILYIAIYIILISIYYFFIKIFTLVSKKLLNLYYLLFLILFFYIIPFLSSSLLKIEYPNINSLLSKAYLDDSLIKKTMFKQADYDDTEKKENINIYKYIFLYLIFSSLLVGLTFLKRKN